MVSANDASTTPDTLRIEHLLANVVRACDLLFGGIVAGFAVAITWLYVLGEARLLTVLGLWSLPIFNSLWSVATRRRARARADLVRGAICLLIATALYVVDQGVLDKLWIPALIMSVGIGLTVGMASRTSWHGCIASLVYAGALLGADLVWKAGFSFAAVYDFFGIALPGCVITMVSNQLGRALDEARRQRDAAYTERDRAESMLHDLSERSDDVASAVDGFRAEMDRRMEAELALRQSHKLESVGRLAAGVAHEINTPIQFVSDSVEFVRTGVTELFAVVGKLEALRRFDTSANRDVHGAADFTTATGTGAGAGMIDDDDMPYLVENIPKALDRALEGLARVTTIVRSMKAFAHPDATEMTPADLNRAIESTLTMARNEYRYVADLETELGEIPLVNCHVGEINQAVLNIVVNAAHAITDVVHGTQAKGRIRVTTVHDGDNVVISISDTGGGIPDHVRDHIFDPFFTTKEVGRGTGQGLAIAHSVVVDKHGGRLDLETELGKGTTFVIQLPIEGRPSSPFDHPSLLATDDATASRPASL